MANKDFQKLQGPYACVLARLDPEVATGDTLDIFWPLPRFAWPQNGPSLSRCQCRQAYEHSVNGGPSDYCVPLLPDNAGPACRASKSARDAGLSANRIDFSRAPGRPTNKQTDFHRNNAHKRRRKSTSICTRKTVQSPIVEQGRK